MKPLIVGEAPSKNEVTERPIEGRIGVRLASMAGLTLPEFLATFDRVNLLHVRQDTVTHGFTFDYVAATQSAALIKRTFQPNQIVLLLGRRAAWTFGLGGEYFIQHAIHGAEVRIVPHPSGINRWWNSPENVRQMNTFMKTIVGRTRG